MPTGKYILLLDFRFPSPLTMCLLQSVSFDITEFDFDGKMVYLRYTLLLHNH